MMGLRRIGQVVWALIGLGLVVLAMAAVGLLFVLAIRAGSTFGAALLAALATVGAAVLVQDFERRRVMEAIRREELGLTYNQMAQVLHGQEMPADERLKLVLERHFAPTHCVMKSLSKPWKGSRY